MALGSPARCARVAKNKPSSPVWHVTGSFFASPARHYTILRRKDNIWSSSTSSKLVSRRRSLCSAVISTKWNLVTIACHVKCRYVQVVLNKLIQILLKQQEASHTKATLCRWSLICCWRAKKIKPGYIRSLLTTNQSLKRHRATSMGFVICTKNKETCI